MHFFARQNGREGVAMFSAIFVMIIVGLLAMQFHYMSRQAQSSAHRFQTSEMARQLAGHASRPAPTQPIPRQAHTQTQTPLTPRHHNTRCSAAKILYLYLSVAAVGRA